MSALNGIESANFLQYFPEKCRPAFVKYCSKQTGKRNKIKFESIYKRFERLLKTAIDGAQSQSFQIFA